MGTDVTPWQAKIDELRTLKDDFNSYGAPKPTEEIIARVEELTRNVQYAKYLTRIKATADGGVAVYFADNTRYANIELDNDRTIGVMLRDAALERTAYFDVDKFRPTNHPFARQDKFTLHATMLLINAFIERQFTIADGV